MRIIALVLAFFIFDQLAFTQYEKVTCDFKSYIHISACFEPIKNIELNSKYKTELKQNSSYFDQHSIMLQSKYKLNKYLGFQLGLGYTWNYGNKSKKWNSYTRTNFDILFKYKISRLNLYYRSHINTNDDLFRASENKDLWFYRNRLKAIYNIRKSSIDSYI